MVADAQRLPASKEETAPATPMSRFTSQEMLNAFRHQRKKRLFVEVKYMPKHICSTPSGIKGRNAWWCATAPPARRNAQRLPASKEETLIVRPPLEFWKRDAQRLPASKEETRRICRGDTIMDFMLNAFRHQRKKRRELVIREQGCLKCSTPSGIKGRNANGLGLVAGVDQGMLNAFRHQRKKRLQCLNLGRCEIGMLNAFRHQRKKRAHHAATSAGIHRRCSTPSGIKGRNAPISLVVINRCLRMLNAFRHQRKKRVGPLFLPSSWHQCSTPSGIKGRNARPAGRIRSARIRMLNAFRHQRKKRNIAGGPRPPFATMLNAFRHQRKKRACQRQDLGRGQDMLNAFRHQRKKRERRHASPGFGHQMLNAFRHQRKKRWRLHRSQ